VFCYRAALAGAAAAAAAAGATAGASAAAIRASVPAIEAQQQHVHYQSDASGEAGPARPRPTLRLVPGLRIEALTLHTLPDARRVRRWRGARVVRVTPPTEMHPGEALIHISGASPASDFWLSGGSLSQRLRPAGASRRQAAASNSRNSGGSGNDSSSSSVTSASHGASRRTSAPAAVQQHSKQLHFSTEPAQQQQQQQQQRRASTSTTAVSSTSRRPSSSSARETEERRKLQLLRQQQDEQDAEDERRDRAFRRAMYKKGLEVVEVDPDGNCLFRSVSFGLLLKKQCVYMCI
jgi:hypothetical protein